MADTKRFLTMLAAACAAASVAAQAPASESEFSLTNVWFVDADLDGGGEMGSSHTSLAASFSNSTGRGRSLGVNFGAVFRDYSLSGEGLLPDLEPFSTVEEYSLGASWRRPVGDAGLIFVAPSLTLAMGDRAAMDESLRIGAIFSYGHRFSDALTIGIGAGVFTGLEETKGFPVLLVAWQINEKWRVGNPFRPGPSGPAGLEIVYSPNPAWEFSLGAGWRSNRFRLDEFGPIPNGIGEVEGIPVFLRLSWSPSETISVDLYGGMSLQGEITYEDASGDEIATDDLDPAPIAAISISARF